MVSFRRAREPDATGAAKTGSSSIPPGPHDQEGNATGALHWSRFSPYAPLERDREPEALEAGALALDTIAAELLRIATSRSPEDHDLSRHAQDCAVHAAVLREMRERRRHKPSSGLV